MSSQAINSLIQSAKNLGNPIEFQPSRAPLEALKRLIKLAEDLDGSDTALQERLNRDVEKSATEGSRTGGQLRFEARACGTPIPTEGSASLDRTIVRSASDVEPSMLDQTFGTEVLRTLAGKSLSSESRIEALRQLTLAMANPTRQNLECVLMILLTDDPDFNQRQ